MSRQKFTEAEQERGRMSRRGLFLLGAASIWLLVGCSGPAATPAPEEGQAAEPALDVQTAPARVAPIGQRITASGTLEARRESRIGTEVQGRIVKVFVDEGDRFAEGDPLFEIDREPYEMALGQAEARLDLARAQRVQGEADLARARLLQKRQVASVQEIERLETALAVARANERQAAETVALARNQIERTLVRAPWAGSVAARLVDEGTTALVQPQTIVLVLLESGTLEGRAAIPESQRARVRVGDPVELHVEGLAEPIRTRISAVGDSVDSATRTYTVRMPVANEDHLLKAGIFALVEILPQAKSDALLVPREAIRSEEGRTRVFTVRDGRATPVPVTLGIVSDTEAEILHGLEPGAPVIVGEAATSIAPGMRVRVVARDDAS
jgi:membrane fusion protein (multidrug efflux system)